jgi:hypothetical protein
VICSTSVFSYLVNSELFCEAEGERHWRRILFVFSGLGVTCLAYRQVQ